jgi:hypothetical protein
MAQPHEDDPIVRAAVLALKAPKKRAFIHAGNRGMRVSQDSEAVIHLPNGQKVQVRTDASGVATEVEFDDHQDAIARPRPIRKGGGVHRG